MENLNLDKYKLAWKNEKSFQSAHLSETEIQLFMKSASKIVGQYKRFLLFDVIFKGILLLSFIVLIFLLKDQSIAILVNSILIIITFSSILLLLKVYMKVDDHISVLEEHLEQYLRTYINFNNGIYVKSIFISALSGSLFFISGVMFYYHNKYGQIPSFGLDDFLVLSIGVILSYGMSAFAQIKQNDFQIRQLESCLVEIEENTMNEQKLNQYRASRMKNMVLIGVILVLGVILFLFLIFSFT